MSCAARGGWAIILVGLLAAAVPGRAPVAGELWERRWIELRTPNFVIASALSEQDSVKLAQDMENFRILVGAVSGAGEIDARVPTRIFVFPSLAAEVGLKGDYIGYFHQGMRANYAAVRPVPGAPLGETLHHEYVHFLLRNESDTQYPTWLDEGLAEFLSTLHLRGDRFEYGNVPKNTMAALAYLVWMDFDELLEVRNTHKLSRERRAAFYAQSWALVHYLANRPGRDFAVDTARYLNAVQTGTARTAGFTQAYGEAVDGLGTRIRRYLGSAKYAKGTLHAPFPAASVSVRLMRTEEIASGIGYLATGAGSLDYARKAYEAARAANPNDAATLAGLGDVAMRAREFDAAEAHYRRAVELEPNSALHLLDLGEYFLRRLREEPAHPMVARWWNEGQGCLQRSYNLDRGNPETLAQMALLFLYSPQTQALAVSQAELAYRLLPSSPEINIVTAQVYAANGRKQEARRKLVRVLSWFEESNTGSAAALLEALDRDAPPDAHP
ncbi:MAG: tetratricopeptide repeat protein [Gammaproteobacteria bacterium]